MEQYKLLIAISLVSVGQPDIVRAVTLAPLAPVSISYDFSGKLVQRWTGGALAAVDYEFTAAPLIRVFSRDGQPLSQIPVSIPRATAIAVVGFARDQAGLVAICGRAVDKDGRQSSFLALFPPDGSAERVVSLNDYYADRIVIAADGTVWTQGYSTAKNAANTDVFRHFDQSGIMINSTIPASTFSSNLTLSDPNDSMAVSTDRVGWYAPREGRYIEISFDGKVTADVKTPIIQGSERVTGFALTDNDQVFISSSTNSQGQRGSKLYTVDKTDGQLIPISLPEDLRLYGADGNNLAVQTRASILKFFAVKN